MTDVFVVGAGPAGLASAIALRLRGFSVTVADPAPPPIDKGCGEGLMPDALAALERLGVALPPDAGYRFRGIRFLGDAGSVDASFPQGEGIGIRRTLLHRALIERAEAVGARLLWGVTVKGCDLPSRWVIGADGENSQVRRWAGLNVLRHESLRFGFRRHYRMKPWTDCVEIYWGEACQIYVTPVAPEEVCVVVISRDQHLRLDQALPRFPEVWRRLEHAEGTTTERGAVTPTRRLARVHNGRVALVGDAAGSVDAITGEGLRLGFEQALALADALATDSLEQYQEAHRRLMRRPAFMAWLMLRMDRSAWIRRRALRALAAEPAVFSSQLAMHVGAARVPDFIRHSMLPLGRLLLTA